MKEFKKIIIALAGFCVCFLILDCGVGKFFDWAIKQMPSEGERVAKSEFFINKVEADFLIIGSSRAEAHYDCKVLTDSLPEYSVFNCGVDGQRFYYINMAFNTIMDRYIPRVVIWDFQLRDLVEDNETENLSLIFPYYYDNPRAKELLDMRDPSLKFMLWNNCYRYNGTASRILRAMRMSESGKMGYLAHATADASRKFDVPDAELKNQVMDSVKISMLEATIKRAQDKGVKLILCVSPYYTILKGEKSGTISCLSNLASINNIPFVDLSQDDCFIRVDSLWYDTGHLNAKGAEAFTKKLIGNL